MKFFVENRILSIAVGASLALHGILLAVHFAAPDAFRLKSTDPGLEVILVNAKHQQAPAKAEALAQANLDGGGNADAGRAKSPLPDARKVRNGESERVAARKIAELEQQQQQIMAQMKRMTPIAAPLMVEKAKPQEPPPVAGKDRIDSATAVARMEAEIAKNIEDYNKRPRKTQITPSTREVGYALYYKTLQERVEKLGTLNFPQQNGKKLYGELVLSIPIFQDGSIYGKEGGVHVERTSGNPVLDRAAVDIVRRSAPFGRFPENMRSSGKDDVWEVITRFKFTRDEGLQAELRGGSN
ncbi:energy transducer TonB [Oxalobacteraceae bacterium CAVE-383]|nr:energy transducer TonB [Oxalobacteraceae bacterium CAVE-383]